MVMLAQAARWLARDGLATSTEARIARLLDDLHAHLEMVEGLHENMRYAMEQAEESAGRPELDPAPQQVLDAIESLDLDAPALQSMRQTPQCVICCADFEVSERLSRLPGCGHLFHDSCVMQWLERASNCPICRCDLPEAVGVTRPAAEEVGSEEAAAGDSSPGERRRLVAPEGSFSMASSSSTSGETRSASASLQSAASAAATAAAAASSALAAEAGHWEARAGSANSASPSPSAARAGGARAGLLGGGGRPTSSVLVGAGSAISIAPGAAVSGGTESPCGAAQARSGSSGLRRTHLG